MMRTLFLLCWLLLTAVCASEPAVLTIDANTNVDKDIVVGAEQRLVIKAGVTLSFTEGAGIVSDGAIEALGTKDKPIEFKPQDKAKGWKNVSLRGPGKDGSVFEHCQFSGGHGRVGRFAQATLQFEKFPGPDEGEGLDIPCGGAMFICGTGKVAIRSCRFEGNEGYWGGAISCWGQASPEILGCLFAGNKGGEDAGAIHCVLESNPLIAGNYFTKNSAQYGGAIHCLHGSKPRIQGNYIVGNTATGNSSAISCFGKASPTIEGNYIADNSVNKENGMAIETVFHSQPVIKGNFIGENKNKTGIGKGLRAKTEFRGQKDDSTCEELEPAAKEAILRSLKEAGVLELAPKQE